MIAKRIEIPHAKREELPQTSAGDMRKQIELVIRETQKGITTDAVARKYHLDSGLTEQIARLYVTHPGVTVDGIMNKMGL